MYDEIETQLRELRGKRANAAARLNDAPKARGGATVDVHTPEHPILPGRCATDMPEARKLSDGSDGPGRYPDPSDHYRGSP